MAQKTKLVSTLKKADTVKGNTVQNSRSAKDIKYNQYRIDHLKSPVEGVLRTIRRWELTVHTGSGKIFHIKRTKAIDEMIHQLNILLNKNKCIGLTQDVYRFQFLGSEKFKTGKSKKHHFEIQVRRFQFLNETFKKVAELKMSTK